MDRIVVRTVADMQRVIDWSEELHGMTFELPFPEGEIEFEEELIRLKFWDEGYPFVRFELWIHGGGATGKGDAEYAKVASWRNDYAEQKIVELEIAGDGTRKAQLGMLLASDNTIGKCLAKFRALMLFSAYYREDILRTKTVSRSNGDGGKQNKRSSRRPLTIRRYTISEEMLSELPAPKKEWHGYRESFGVRGHFRKYSSGKTVWVRPYEKKGRNDKRGDREYIL